MDSQCPTHQNNKHKSIRAKQQKSILKNKKISFEYKYGGERGLTMVPWQIAYNWLSHASDFFLENNTYGKFEATHDLLKGME